MSPAKMTDGELRAEHQRIEALVYRLVSNVHTFIDRSTIERRDAVQAEMEARGLDGAR